LISPELTKEAPYHITATIPPKSAKIINEIKAPRKPAAFKATETTRLSPFPYRLASYCSPVKDFTVIMDCKVSSTMTFAAANSSWVALESFRIYLPNTMAITTKTGKVANINEVNFGVVYIKKTVPANNVIIWRNNSAKVTEKVS